MANLDIESVPFFDRPQSSGPKDRFIGKDEAGNSVFETVTGEVYTIKPAADQRTTRTKIEEDVVPAVKEYIRDPSLPSAEQMKQFGVDAMTGAYESVSDAVRGRGTYGDVFGVAGSASMSSVAEVPEGAVRSFGGRSKSGPVKVPRFRVRGENTQYPSPTFGNKKLRDIFEEDQWENHLDLNFEPEQEGTINEGPFFVNPENGDTFGSGPEFELGYAPNLRVHDLANVALGRNSIEEVLDYIGMDPEPKLVNYVNQRLSNLQERPEFQEYLERYRVLNEEYDPYGFLGASSRTSNQVAVFRSPIPEVINQLTFPKDGIKGSQLLKEFQDSPSIRASEFKSLGVKINPQQKYTREEVDNLFEGKLWDASVYLVEQPMYSSLQRQPVLDPGVDYFELIVNANSPSGKNFRAISQHFENNTLSHARASVKADTRTGQDYILLEELQSDLLQKGFETKPLPNSDRVYAKYGLHITPSDLDEFVKASDDEIAEGLSIAADINQYKEFNALPEELKDAHEKFINNSSEGSFRAYRVAMDIMKYYPAREVTTISELLTEIRDDLRANPERELPKPPIQKTEEGVRLAFDGLLAEAATRDISRIVIPPFERIVAERFTPGSARYFNALKPSSGFSATYKKALNKILKEYEEELGRENFSTRLVDIDYEPMAYKDKDTGKVVDLPTTGIEVSFKGALDQGYDFTAPKFAEGGLVQKYNKGGTVEKQMNRLYQEGGLADDGARVEPVTGNEVPPGSLSEEVRDNVDAKLSEGEYVVPADVVRYYGVRFFEALRAKAKEAFSKMESEGRIGGEPVDAQGVPMEDDELTPEEMQMLAEALGQAPQGMAMGGMVQQQPIPAYNPYAQQQMQYNNPNMRMPVGMAEGGEVKAPKFNPSQYQLYPSGNQMGAGSGGGIEIVDYINVETGQIRPITLLNGQPMGLVPEGFVRATPENREQAMENAGMASEQMGEKTTEEVLDVRDDSESEQRRMELSQDQANRGSQYKSWAEKNIEKIDKNPEEFVKELLSPSIEGKVVKGLSKAAIGMGGIAGLGLGIAGAAFSELNPLAKARAVREDLKARGIDTTTVDGYIKSYVDELPNALDAIDESWASGKGFLSGITDVRSSMGSTTSKPKEKLFVPSASKKTSTEDGAAEEKRAQERYDAFQKQYEENVKDAQENQYGQTTGKGLTVEDIEDDLMPMAEGGFVAKPSKYKSKVTRKTEKKRRGLGSK